MSNYENAPATTLLAVYCACCSRPLVDAVSVETGVGPECRKMHGYTDAQSEPNWDDVHAALPEVIQNELADTFDTLALQAMESEWRLGGLETRKVANVLVHRIAVEQKGATALALVNAVRALGFVKLAARIGERLATIRIERTGGRIVVRAPYSPDQVIEFRKVPGRKFGKEGKDAFNTFPEASEKALFGALRRCYAGRVVQGPKGLFVLAA